ncbi:MAG: hypothetical protein ABI406_00770 [Ktedonobacteraceae bacterium]
MDDTLCNMPPGELSERQVAQLRREIASFCETMYRTLADLHEPQARQRYMQECREPMVRYNDALSALIGTETAGNALYEICDRTLKQQIAIVLHSERPERCRTLWILVCHEKDSDVHEAVPFYAANADDAEQQAQYWLNTDPRPLIHLNLRPYPRGFMMGRRMLEGMII